MKNIIFSVWSKVYKKLFYTDLHTISNNYCGTGYLAVLPWGEERKRTGMGLGNLEKLESYECEFKILAEIPNDYDQFKCYEEQK